VDSRESQLRDFEEPTDAIAIDGTQTVERITRAIRRELGI
jgi:hypothetical protein